MRVTEETPNILIVEEAPWGFRAILLVCTAALAWGLYENWSESHWFMRLFLGAFVALMLLIYIKVTLTITARFDRGAGTIEIKRRGLLDAHDERYNFRHFQRARVEESTDSDGSTFRLILVFSDAMPAAIDPTLRDRLARTKRRTASTLGLNEVPFTSYLSSGRDSPTKAAAAINAWARVAPG